MCGEGKACGGDSSKNQLTFQPVEALMARSTRGVFCSIWDASSSSPSVISCAALVSHGWVPDHEALSCMACKKTFTQVRRRVFFFSSFIFFLILNYFSSSIIVESVEEYFVEIVHQKNSHCLKPDSVNLFEFVINVILLFQQKTKF